MKTIKSVKLSIRHLNVGKKRCIENIHTDMTCAVQFYIDYLWNNEITWVTKNKEITVVKTFSIKNKKLDVPSFIKTSGVYPQNTKLSARLLKCAATQACTEVSKAVDNYKKTLFVLNKLKSENKRTRKISKILTFKSLKKPIFKSKVIELNSIVISFGENNKSNKKCCDAFVTIQAIKNYLQPKQNKLNCPLKLTSIYNKYKLNGKILSGIGLSKDDIYIRYEVDDVKLTPKKTVGRIVGVDSGINSIITCSDGQKTTSDKHGHTLNSILNKIKRKKPGSKNFKKAINHKDNFIRWSIKNINFENIREARLENVTNFRKNKNVGRFLNHSSESLIRKLFVERAESFGVQVILQNSSYRSQRCSKCGYVSNLNRKNKAFSCKHCSYQADADYNASCNHECNLPSADWIRKHLGKNPKFFWYEEGFRDLSGMELTVPSHKK